MVLLFRTGRRPYEQVEIGQFGHDTDARGLALAHGASAYGYRRAVKGIDGVADITNCGTDAANGIVIGNWFVLRRSEELEAFGHE